MKFFRRFFSRYPVTNARAVCECGEDRRLISAEGRDRWETWQREKLEIEERLRLVDMQAKVIDHVTAGR